MKIINTFLFSEPHEATLLLLKLTLENTLVDEFIILENEFDFKGNWKGNHAQTILYNSDFKTFLPKIQIISVSNRICGGSTEKDNFTRENWQRAIAHDYICGKYANEDMVIISDTDEMFDFTDIERATRFLGIIQNNTNKISRIGRQRYWYDFDNICFYPKFTIPVVPVSLLKSNIKNWETRYKDDNSYYCGNTPIAFEYSYCFANLKQLMRKKTTYSHTGFTETDVKNALSVNSWVRSPNRGEKLGDCKYDYFEFVTLNEYNSPAYVRQNLSKLKTNIVDPNYKQNRLMK